MSFIYPSIQHNVTQPEVIIEDNSNLTSVSESAQSRNEQAESWITPGLVCEQGRYDMIKYVEPRGFYMN